MNRPISGMPDRAERAAPSPRLDERAQSLYGWVVRSGHMEAAYVGTAATELGLEPAHCQDALDTLAALHLLRPHEEHPDRLVPVSPEAATAQLLGAEEAELRAAEAAIRDRQARLDQLKADLSTLSPLYLDGRDRTAGAFQLLEDMHMVRAALSDAVANCTLEVLAIQPGGGHPEAALYESLARDTAMLNRGVRLRSIYQHLTRFHQPTRSYADVILAAGAEIRTRAEVPSQMIIVDRLTAFVPARLETGGALVVREPSMVAFLIKLFDNEWGQAVPFATGPAAARTVSEAVKHTIATLLADGVKDDVIARRLGMSTRTCRRHIAELLEQLGAQSRFQAGALAERLGLTTPDRPLDTTEPDDGADAPATA